jgi:hypothetical protein
MHEITNVDVDKSGVMRPRKMWRTFAGMVWQLWLINKRFKKLGIVGDFTVRLPLPGKYPMRSSIKSEPMEWQGPDSVHSVGLDLGAPEVEYNKPPKKRFADGPPTTNN